MTQEVNAGRLTMDAYVDTTGVTRGLQARLDTELARIRAKIKASIDTSGIAREARRAAKEASGSARVKLRAELDQRSLVAQVRAASVAAAAGAVINFRAEVDQGSIAAAKAELEALAQDRVAEIRADADISAAEAKLDAFRTEQERRKLEIRVDADLERMRRELEAERIKQQLRPINIRINFDRNGLADLGKSLMQLGKIPAIAGGVYLLVAAVGQLGAGLFAMTSYAAQAVSTLAMLPNLVGVAVQAIAPLIIGFQGIGGALSAMSAQHLAAGQAAATGAQQQQTAARAIVDAAWQIQQAEQALADARHAAEDHRREAAHSIAQAEYALAQSQDDARAAQDELNIARQTAAERIRDLNRELIAAHNTELDALNAVQSAKEALQDVKWDKSSTDKERRDAEQALRDAQDDMKAAKDNRGDLAKEAEEANRKGVSGSDEVVAARERIADANHSVEESEYALAQARHSAADQAHADAEAIASAQHAVEMAHRGAGDAAQQAADASGALATANFKLQTAMDNLSPAARRMAEYLYSLRGRMREFRDAVATAMLPPLQRGIEAALPLLDTLQAGLVVSGRIMGRFGERLGKLFGSKAFNTDVGHIMDENNGALRRFTHAGFNMVKMFQDLAVVAGPVLLRPFSKWVEKLTKGWRESMHTGRETGTLKKRLIDAREAAKTVWHIIGNLAGALHGLGSAATPAGKDLMHTFEKVTQKWEKFTKSTEGKAKIAKFFEDIKPAVEAISDAFAQFFEAFAKLGQHGGGPMVGAMKVIGGLFSGLVKVLDTPILGDAVGWILTIVGGLGALFLILGPIVSIFGTLISVIGLFMNPVGLAIAIVAVLIGAFVLAYKKIEWFRDAVNWVLDKIMDGWSQFSAIFQQVWDRVAKPILNLLGRRFRQFGQIVSHVWSHFIRPALNRVGDAIAWLWEHVARPAFRALVAALRLAGRVVSWLWSHAVRPAFNAIGNAIEWAWDHIIRPAFEALRDFIRDTIPNAFQRGVDAVRTIWDTLRRIARAPVEFLVNTVYNDGIRRMVNAIPGVPDLDPITLNWATGTSAVLPGYTPGRDVHSFLSTDGRTRLNLSGGEGILRPEVVRELGPRAIDAINGAARKGKDALRGVLGLPVDHSRADGGILPRLAARAGRSLSYWLGGVLPLPGATSIASHGSAYPFPAYDLNMPGYADYGKPIVAWKSGVAAPFDLGSDKSYGRGQQIEHAGTNSLYAHMSAIVKGIAGEVVRAGQTIGYVGDYGNTGSPPTSHLHFEIRGGGANLSDTGTGADPHAQQREEKSGWLDAVGAIKDALHRIPGMLGNLGDLGEWGGMLVKGVRNLGSDVIQWINDKIPNSFGPIPFPDNPVPNIFDRGGALYPGSTFAYNGTGRVETVFTNENVVDMTRYLARVASSLTSVGGDHHDAPLVGNLTLQARPQEMPGLLRDANWELTRMRRGGVHAKRA